MSEGKNSGFISDKYTRFENVGNALHTFGIDDFGGGVRLCKSAGKDCSVLMINMISDEGRLCSLPEPESVTVSDTVAESLSALSQAQIKKHCRGDASDMLVIGSSAVMRFASGNTVVYKDIFSAASQAVFFYGGYFFAADGSKVYKFSASEGTYSALTPKIPLMFSGVSADGNTYTRESEQINLLCDSVAVKYSAEAKETFVSPSSMNASAQGVMVKDPSGRFLSDSEFTAVSYGTKIRVTLTTAGTSGGYTVYFRLAEGGGLVSASSVKKMKNLLFGASSYTVGEASGDFPVLICTCGDASDKRKAGFFKMDADTLYMPYSECSAMNIPYKTAAILPYSGGYALLCDQAVYKMQISADGKAENSSVSLIKSDFGCDMPGSAVAFNDKIVFANSKRGIFYFDKYGFSERDMNKKISADIEGGEYGFFACSEEDRQNAKADFCGGYYAISIGTKTYLWNFFAHAPTNGADSEKNERDHVWYMRNDMNVREFLSSSGNEIYYIPQGSAVPVCAKMNYSSESTSGNLYGSITSDFSMSGKEKIVTGIRIFARSGGVFTVSLGYDGVASPDVYTAGAASSDGMLREYRIRPFRRRFNFFRIEISSENPIMIDRILIDFIPVK